MRDFVFTGIVLGAIVLLTIVWTLPYLLAIVFGGWLLKSCGIF